MNYRRSEIPDKKNNNDQLIYNLLNLRWRGNILIYGYSRRFICQMYVERE